MATAYFNPDRPAAYFSSGVDPGSGQFSLSVGVVNGKAGVKIDHQPHYNNSFTRYWIFDETETRFRQLQSEQSQGC